jgi:cell division protein FtsW
VVTVSLLVAVGVVMALSTTMADSPSLLANTQFLKLALAALGLVAFIPAAWLRRAAFPLLLVAGAGLVAVLVPGLGSTVNGASRWLRFHGLSLQPSELAKLALVLSLARWLGEKEERPRSFWAGYLPALCVTGLMAVLILKEPDFGTACLVGLIGVVMMFIAGVRVTYLLPTVLAAVPLLWFLVSRSEYRMHRMLAFMNPWAYPDSIGFHVIQSLIALGSGGVYGVGLGQGQQKLSFLFEADTDFVFAVVGEELGYLGALLVIGLFVVLIWQLFRIAERASSRFGFLAACGVGTWLGMQALVHIGVVSKALPTKGIPLPFISCGGSSLFAAMLAMGLVMSIGRAGAAGEGGEGA